jgi:hypothetical protein
MEYNLAKHAYTKSNTTVGNISLTASEVVSLLDLSFATNNLATISGSSILAIDCDLGTRVHLNSVDYYFVSDQDTDAVASGVELYYKNEPFESYDTAPFTYHSGNKYTVALPVTPFAPRYLRVVHTVSGTSISGTIMGLEIINDETTIDFGTDGSLGDHSVTTSLLSDDVISTIPIYNDGSTIADAYANIDLTHTEVDHMLTLSASPDGPWEGIRTGKVVMGPDRWDYLYKYRTNTDHSDGYLRQRGIILGDAHYVQYETPITQITSPPFYQHPSKYMTVALDVVVNSGQVAHEVGETGSTMEIRHSNKEPLSYMFYRRMLGKENDVLYFKDFWLHDSSEKYELLTSMAGIADRNPYFRVHIDKKTDRWATLVHTTRAEYSTNYYTYVITRDGLTGTTYSTNLLLLTNNSYTTSFDNVELDTFGGVWIYYYSSKNSSSYYTDTVGYHLGYFHRGMSQGFHLSHERRTIEACSVVYDTGELWYLDSVLQQVIKIDYDGNNKAQYQTEEGTFYAVQSTEDGGCWFSLDGDLHRLDSDGILVETIEGPGVTESITQLALDVSDSTKMWFADGEYLVWYDMVNEKIDMRIDVGQAMTIQALPSGAFCFCGDDYNRYITKSNRRIEKEYYFGAKTICGAMESTHEEDTPSTNDLPIPIDSDWNDLDWNVVSPDTYTLPDYKYHQVRVSLLAGNVDTVYGEESAGTWDVDDEFDGESDHPYNSRWDYVDDRITLISGSTMFKKDGSGDPYITSKNKWYLRKDSVDLRVEWQFKDVAWPYDQNMYIYMYGADVATGEYNGTYMYAYLHRSTNTRVYWYIYVKNGYDYDSYTYSYTDTSYVTDHATLRLRTSGDRAYCQWYDHNTGSWMGEIYRDGVNNMISPYFYVHIKSLDGYENVYLNKFQRVAGTFYVAQDSPVLQGMYLQTPTVVEDIWPQQYKNLYMKTSMANANSTSNGQYSSNINVWWDVPV